MRRMDRSCALISASCGSPEGKSRRHGCGLGSVALLTSTPLRASTVYIRTLCHADESLVRATNSFRGSCACAGPGVAVANVTAIEILMRIFVTECITRISRSQVIQRSRAFAIDHRPSCSNPLCRAPQRSLRDGIAAHPWLVLRRPAHELMAKCRRRGARSDVHRDFPVQIGVPTSSKFGHGRKLSSEFIV